MSNIDDTGAELIVDWTANLQLEGGGNQATLTFGFSPDATDSFDQSIDVASDPADPAPSFHAALSWDSTDYQKLVLNGDPGDLIEHQIEVKLQFDEDELISIEWDNSSWADYMDSATLVDAYGGTDVNIDMFQESMADIADSGIERLWLRITPKAQEVPQMEVNWTADITAEGGGENSTLTFGFSPLATDNFDMALDILSSDPDPEPSFHAAFGWNLQSFEKLVLNGDPDDLVEHVIEIKLQYADDELITLEWDNAQWGAYMTSCQLVDPLMGQEVNVDMMQETTVDLADSGLTSLLMKVVPKADFVSVPVDPDPDPEPDPDPNLQAPDFLAEVLADNGGMQTTLTFGFSPNATDEFDDLIDIEASAPPAPPAFDAALNWEGDRFSKVVLNGDLNDLLEHVFMIELQFNEGDDVLITWDNSQWADWMQSARLVDTFDGNFVDVDMLTATDAEINDTNVSLLRMEITPKAAAAPEPEVYETPADLKKMVFEATVRDTDDAFLTQGEFIIQNYNSSTQTWENLVSATLGDNGLVNASYALVDQSGLIETTIWSGLIPMLRLADKLTLLDPSPKVFAFGGQVEIDEENFELKINFGEFWQLQEIAAAATAEKTATSSGTDTTSKTATTQSTESKTNTAGELGSTSSGSSSYSEWTESVALDFKKAAILRPSLTDGMFPAFLAAVNQPEKFADFDPAVNQVSIRPIGSPSLETDIVVLTSQIELLEAQIALMTVEVDSQEVLIQSQDKVRVALESERDTLQLQVDAIQRTPRAVDDVYTEIVNDVEAASQQLADNRFEVSNIKINLKTHVVSDAEGIKLQPVDAATAVTTTEASVSDVQLEIGVKPLSAPTTATITPKVTGLTETAARQRLNSVGLKLKAIYQASQGQVIGQGFKQVPEAGADIVPNDVVTVIFAKNEGDFN